MKATFNAKKLVLMATIFLLIPGIVEPQNSNTSLEGAQFRICNILEQFYNLIVYVSTGVGALMIVIMGVLWVSSADNSKMRTQAKTAIVHVIVGLLVISLALFIVSIALPTSESCITDWGAIASPATLRTRVTSTIGWTTTTPTTSILGETTTMAASQIPPTAIVLSAVSAVDHCYDGVQNRGEVGLDCGGDCKACPSCYDGVQNQGETGLDCGGVCGACPSCYDGIQNQGEAGVDCGGPCNACSSCYDGIQNQGEAGVDCGGPCGECGASCSDGIRNRDEEGVDCGGQYCKDCPSCSDGLRNQGEVGIDCGGPCPLCPPASCRDGIRNQNELGVDCGGVCGSCITCYDGIQNQNESGVDCGGPCRACPPSAVGRMTGFLIRVGEGEGSFTNLLILVLLVLLIYDIQTRRSEIRYRRGQEHSRGGWITPPKDVSAEEPKKTVIRKVKSGGEGK